MTLRVTSQSVLKLDAHHAQQTKDLLALEEPLELRIGYGPSHDRQMRNLAVTMRTPGHDQELALGFLLTENIIQRPSQVISIKHCQQVSHPESHGNILNIHLAEDLALDWSSLQRNFYTSSSCGVCGKASLESVRQACPLPATQTHWAITPALLYLLPDHMRKAQAVFKHTGGLHAAALFDREGELVLMREDIGRHNALDKIIGAALSQDLLPLNELVLMLSGRSSFELIQKAAMAGISFVAAVGAPSSLAVSLAQDQGITLVGFLRGQKANVYTGFQRILTHE